MKTRIAPSPTGFFHLGTLRTAYFNWLGARSSGGTFLLRIDDTDKERSKQEYSDYILNIMDYYKLDYDNCIYQSQRLVLYMENAIRLVNKGLAYEKDGAFWIDENVIIKSDGTPTYNFSSVCDDIHEHINCIIRGVDHIPNLEIQKKYWEMLSTEHFPYTFHVGLLFDGNKKLSKRENNGNVEAYKSMHKEAVLNWVLKMGWSSKDPNFDKTTPLINRELAKKLFWEGNLQDSPSKLNFQKLTWYHKQYSKIKV